MTGMRVKELVPASRGPKAPAFPPIPQNETRRLSGSAQAPNGSPMRNESCVVVTPPAKKRRQTISRTRANRNLKRPMIDSLLERRVPYAE